MECPDARISAESKSARTNYMACYGYDCETIILLGDPTSSGWDAWATNSGNQNTTSGSGGSGGLGGSGGYGPTCNPNLAPGTSVPSNQLPSCIPVTQAGGFGNMVFYANAGQFKMTPADQASCPRFTEMVKDLKDFVKNDKQVMNALKIYSGLTETQILDNVTFGNGPTLKITDFAPGSTSIGQYNRFEPNVLRIRDSYVRGLEQANLKSTREGTGFLLAVAILHEFIHASRHQNTLPDSDLIEYGFEFEKKAFGIIVDDRNANGYSYRFYEK